MIGQMKPVEMMHMRKKLGLSRAELARRTKMQQNVIAWIETGRFIPYPSQIEKLAAALGVDDADLLLEQIEGGEIWG